MLSCYGQTLMVSYRMFLSSLFLKVSFFLSFLCNMKSNQKLWVKFPPSFFTTERSWHHLLHTFVTQKIASHQVPVSLASFLGVTNSCVMQ